MSEHYVCKGECGSTSDTPMVCSAEGCSKNGEQMESCHCVDGRHESAQSSE